MYIQVSFHFLLFVYIVLIHPYIPKREFNLYLFTLCIILAISLVIIQFLSLMNCNDLHTSKYCSFNVVLEISWENYPLISHVVFIIVLCLEGVVFSLTSLSLPPPQD